MKIHLLLIFAVLAILPFAAFSLGISPASMELEYVPGKSDILTFSTSSKGEYMQFNASVSGDFTSSFIVPKDIYDLRGGSSFSVQLIQPVFETPGNKDTFVCANEVPKKSYGQNTLSAVVSVCARVSIYVPYPEKYLEVSMSTSNVNHGETVYFLVDAISRGAVQIGAATGNIKIFDADRNILKAVVPLTPLADISTNKRGQMYAEWSSLDGGPGKYKAVATINYDEETIEDEALFRVGTQEVTILNYTDVFVSGEIRPFTMTVENQWNGPVSEVFGEIIVYDNQSRQIRSAKTTSTTIDGPFEIKDLYGYLDASGLTVGEYDIDARVHFNGRFNGEKGKITILKEKRVVNIVVGLSVVMISLIIVVLGIVLISKKGVQNSLKKKRQEMSSRIKKRINTGKKK